MGRNLLGGYDAWRTRLKAEDHPEFLAREVEDVFRSYCAGLARSDSFDLRACVTKPESAPEAEPAPKVKPPPQGVAARKSHPLALSFPKRAIVRNGEAKVSKGAPSPAKASQPEAQRGFMDTTLISERDRDIPDDEYSPTNVCIFPESWEEASNSQFPPPGMLGRPVLEKKN